MNILLSLALLGIVILFVGIWKKKNLMLPVITSGLVICFGINLLDWNTNVSLFNNMLVIDNFTVAFSGLMLLCTILIFLLPSSTYRMQDDNPHEDIFSVWIFSLFGAVALTSFNNMMTLFVSLEIMSISLYILAGTKPSDYHSKEASMKYFLTGSFATGFLLFGIALIYGATGSFDLASIAQFVKSDVEISLMFKTGVLLLLVGMAFKVAAVPFHFWAPDVYHGSPTVITAYMASVVKIAGFAAFYRLFSKCFADVQTIWNTAIWVFAALSIFVGNITAIFQDRTKRMLAYSSIAHTGYILLAMSAIQANSERAILLYSVSYSLATVASFVILVILRKATGDGSLTAFKGIGLSNPLLGVTMTLALLSLTGIPPMAGFMAKYFVFRLAIQNGLVWLVILAVIGSAISIYYYFRPIIYLYFHPRSETVIALDIQTKILLILLSISILVVGLFPNIVLYLL